MSRKAITRSVVALKQAIDPYITGEDFPLNLPESVKNDLKKVEFDTENVEVVPPGFCKYPCGYELLENGLAVMFINAGGDWEFPICFIIYLDHKDRLRGYIPIHGNVYNKKYKSAYGNNNDDPDPDSNDPCLKVDPVAIRADIVSRIKIVKS